MPPIANLENKDFIPCSKKYDNVQFFTEDHFDIKKINSNITVNTITGCGKFINGLTLNDIVKRIPIEQEGLIDMKNCVNENIKSIPLGDVYEKVLCDGTSIKILPHSVTFKYVFQKNKTMYIADTYIQEVRFQKTKAGTPQLMKCQYNIPEACLMNKPKNGQYSICDINNVDKTISVKYTINADLENTDYTEKIWTIPNPKKKFRNCIITNLCIGYMPIQQPLRKSLKKYGMITHERVKVNFKIFSNGTINFSGCTNIDIINYSINKLLGIFNEHMGYNHIHSMMNDIIEKVNNAKTLLVEQTEKFKEVNGTVTKVLKNIERIQGNKLVIETTSDQLNNIITKNGFDEAFINVLRELTLEINTRIILNNKNIKKPTNIKLYFNELNDLLLSIQTPYRQRINMINCKFRYQVGVKLTKIIELMNEQNVVEKRPVKVKHYQGLKIEYPKNPNVANKKNNKNPTIIVFEQQRNKHNSIPGSSIILTGCKNDTDIINCYNLINNFLNDNLNDIQERQTLTEQLLDDISSDDE